MTTDDAYIPISEIDDQTDNVFFFNLFTDDDIPMMMVDGTLDITSCDPEAKQVSGTFTFFDEENNEVSGSFTNLCYRNSPGLIAIPRNERRLPG